MTRLLISAAAIAIVAAPAIAETKKPVAAPAKHKVVKTMAKTTTAPAKKTK